VEEKDDVFMIKYQNGDKDVFGVKTESQSQDVLIKTSSVMTMPSLSYDKIQSLVCLLAVLNSQLNMPKGLWEPIGTIFKCIKRKEKKVKN
jgi:hypothetical protein